MAEAICDKFSVRPQLCDNLDPPGYMENDPDTHYLAIFLILAGMIIILFLMLYFYKRMMRREMTKDMSIQISQMVSQYFALNEDGRKGKADNL